MSFHPLRPIGRVIVGPPDRVLVLVPKSRLDHIGIEAAFVEMVLAVALPCEVISSF
jgi:hypothetical protein